MPKELLINYSQLLKIRDDIDSLLGNNKDIRIEQAVNLTNIRAIKKIDAQYEIDEKEKKILKFILDNPGGSKETVIKNLGMSSRVPILNRIKRLEGSGYIICKKNEKNSQIHELFYNDENSLSILIKNLGDFKKIYFLLLDNTKKTLNQLSKNCEKQMRLIKENHEMDKTDFSCGELQSLSQHIISPLRNLIMILLYSNFIPFNIKEYNEYTILGKFSVINDFIKDVIIKLIDVFPNYRKWQMYNEITVIQGLEYEMLPSSIEENINFFAKYNLKRYAIELWESLWKLIHPFLRLFMFYIHIGEIMKRNSINSISELLTIKSQYYDIEKHYKYKN